MSATVGHLVTATSCQSRSCGWPGPGSYAAGENYLPESLKDRRYYQPSDRGLEQKISEKLQYLRERDKMSTIRRYE